MKISEKWSDMAKKRLDPEDQVQKTWFGKIDGKGGILLLSNKKLLFVEEKGFMRTTYSLALEIPYEKIEKTTVEGRYQLAFTEVGGRRHNFTSSVVPISTIERSLKDLIE